MNFDAEKATRATVEWIRDWFGKNGPGCNAIVGISGGKDSSIAAALCVEALGKDHVIEIGSCLHSDLFPVQFIEGAVFSRRHLIEIVRDIGI